jgi:hypothetical protein
MMFFDKLDCLLSEIVDFADHRFYGFVLIFAEKSQMPRLRFEHTTLGSDFSIIIFSVLAVTATWLLV